MTVTHIEDYLASKPKTQPRQICFFSPTYRNTEGADKTLSICVEIKDGDVAGILSVVVENGGIGRAYEDGTYYFIPWPCAAVEIRDTAPTDDKYPDQTVPE